MRESNMSFSQNIYLSTYDVARRLQIGDSCIRFWCDEFDDFLKIRRSGRNRQFTENDIEKLKFIKYLLKDKKLTIRLAREYLSTDDGRNMKPLEKTTEKILYSFLTDMNDKLKIIASIQNYSMHSELESLCRDNTVTNSQLNFEKLSSIHQGFHNKDSPYIVPNKEIIWKQIDIQICFLKNIINKYNVSKENQLFEELLEAVQEIVKRNEKIEYLYKVLNKLD